jgi:tetratricopeptide (TPR) repeat protein/tRNA A-37 threonylcarbamoyl transferase component Bud32
VNRPESLIDVAVAVADGSPVEWERVERQSHPGSRVVAHNLALLERIASVHAALPVAAFERSLHDSLSSLATDPPADEARVRWGPLTIVQRIGRGTYADVYLARDPRLDRPVALKLLRRRDLDDAAETEAIEEARLLARVRHPKVITVYGAERIDGRAGIWMEFVDGRTLEEELRDRGPLPTDDIVAIGAALCGAVSAVHAAGLLHRDIKTQNVMRGTDGRIVLSDFGTSHEISGAASARSIAGTPLYLAPEVLRGEPASAASDVYSVGVLLYHLATGAFPVCGRSVADLRDALITNVRVPVRERRRDLPKPVASVIERATDPLPERRYASASAMGAALAAAAMDSRSRLGRAIAAIAVTAAIMTGAWGWTRSPGARHAPALILVGAFDNHTSDPRLDDVVQFAFAQELMQSRAVTIVPPERIGDTLGLMKRPPSTPLDAPTARELCLRDGSIPMYATGRIDRVGTNYTIHATIARAATGAAVAQETIDVGAIDGVLDGVRTLAARIRTAVGDDRRQVEADARLERVTTGSLDALREYTAGMALVDERRWPAAELRLAEAVRLDPSFASAMIMLADGRRTALRRPSTEYLPLAERAFQLARGLPSRERYYIEGTYYLLIGDTTSATAALEALTREYPNDFWGLFKLADAYDGTGRYRDEIPISRRMAALRPNDFIALLENAAALVVIGGGLPDAHQIADRASRLERPGGVAGDVYGAWLDQFPAFEAWAEGRIADAASLLDALGARRPVSDRHAFGLGQMNLALGRVQAAERAFQSMSSPAEREAMLAYAALARGDVSGARAALVRAAPQLMPALGVGSFGRAAVMCWSLLRTGLLEECRRLGAQRPLTMDGAHWIVGEIAAADRDHDAALPILQHVRRQAPGLPHMFLAIDTLAGIYEQRGDLEAAADALRQSDGAQHAVYPQSGAGGFWWLQTRAHLLKIERRLGHRDRADAISRELQHLLAVADPDFVLRQAVP